MKNSTFKSPDFGEESLYLLNLKLNNNPLMADEMSGKFNFISFKCNSRIY